MYIIRDHILTHTHETQKCMLMQPIESQLRYRSWWKFLHLQAYTSGYISGNHGYDIPQFWLVDSRLSTEFGVLCENIVAALNL